MRDSQNVLLIGLSMTWIIWVPSWNLSEIPQGPHLLPANSNNFAGALYDMDMIFAYQQFKITKSLQNQVKVAIFSHTVFKVGSSRYQ